MKADKIIEILERYFVTNPISNYSKCADEIIELKSLPEQTEGEYYKTVYIKSEADLPKEDGDYIVHSKAHGWTGLGTWKNFENPNYPEYNQYLWLLNYDWYLQPIEQPLADQPDKPLPLKEKRFCRCPIPQTKALFNGIRSKCSFCGKYESPNK